MKTEHLLMLGLAGFMLLKSGKVMPQRNAGIVPPKMPSNVPSTVGAGTGQVVSGAVSSLLNAVVNGIATSPSRNPQPTQGEMIQSVIDSQIWGRGVPEQVSTSFEPAMYFPAFGVGLGDALSSKNLFWSPEDQMTGWEL